MSLLPTTTDLMMPKWSVEQGNWRQQTAEATTQELTETISEPGYVAEAQAAFGVPAELGEVSEHAARWDQRGLKLAEVNAYGGMVVARVESTTRRARLAAASMINGTQR
jgi:hypothetical protein